MNGFEIDEAEVAYWGRCPACQQSSEKSKKVSV
jgi:Fe2+ or Zn2+ uptake regulation protein